MTELGYATLPRGRRLPPTPNGLSHHNNKNNHTNHHNHCNGHLPPVPPFKNHNNNLDANVIAAHPHALFQLPTTVPITNGIDTCINGNGTSSKGIRAIHDGFATIRSGGNKRGRSRSTPTVTTTNPAPASTPSPCHHPCCHPMEPLWEEKGGCGGSGQKVTVARRDRSQLPWWEVATRRSRYRSCPAFSQASMVTALEQTMTNVTDRLERLASSPDLKESEAAELRKTAAVLRQQSSAVCQSVTSGCHSMERQLSCDSVSSVTSTVSGASLSSYASLGSHSLVLPSATSSLHCSYNHTHPPHTDANNATAQAKLKKRSWLRSSFRRAFGRPGRKRKQGDGTADDASRELPLHHTANTAVRHLPVPPPLARSPLQQNKKQAQQKIPKQQNVFEESEVLTRLQEEVNEKERALTETRLELLSGQHQIQAQVDTIARLQGEVVGLREENKRLVNVVREQKGPSADMLMGPLTHTFSTLTLKAHSGKGLNATSPREEGRVVKVLLVNRPGLTSPTLASSVTLHPADLTHIGNVNVGSKTTWDILDAMVVNTVKDYGNRVDPVSALGLDSAGCLLCYRVEGVVSGPSLPRPELLPYGYCVGMVDALHVWLKGGYQKREGESMGSLSSACFTSLIPAPSLTPLASLLLSHPRLVLAGPPASGKTHLARTLAEFLVRNSGREPNEDNIKVFKVTGANSLELCQLLSSIWPRGLSGSARSTTSLSSTFSTTSTFSAPSSTLSSHTSPSSITTSTISSANAPPFIPTSTLFSTNSSTSTLSACSTTSVPSPISASPITSNLNMETNSMSLPAVIILDDLHAAGGVVETLQRCLPTTPHTGPAIITTCCPTATLSTRLQIHCNFRWSSLSLQQEPVRGLLGRALRRKVAAAEVAANTRLPDAHHLAEWLTRLWLHLNTQLSGHCGSNDVGIGPGLLIDCPLGQEETQAWFTEVWNSKIVPYIVATMRASATSNTATLDTWTDPLDWVLATYPWPHNAACGPDQLARIPTSDVRQKEASASVTRSASTHRPYTPLSVCQQKNKPESVYAVPQLLPRSPPVSFRTIHGSGQNIRERSNTTGNTGHPPVTSTTKEINSAVGERLWRSGSSEITNNPTTIRCDTVRGMGVTEINDNPATVRSDKLRRLGSSEPNDNPVTVRRAGEQLWRSGYGESNDNLATIRRARSKSCTNTGPKPITVASQNINGDYMVLTSGTSNNKFPVFTVGRLANGTKSQENVSNGMKLTPLQLTQDKIQNLIPDKESPIDDEDEAMESDCLMDNASDSTEESDLQSIKSADSRNKNTNLISKDELAMETDLQPYNTEPESLDVLAKNVLNNNGLSPECVKIIRGAGRKMDLKGLAHELTTTFKPVESAI